MTPPTAVLGIDCATQLKNVGVAAGFASEGRLRCRGLLDPAIPTIAGWIGEHLEHGHRVLLALDAPLGWPREMGDTLAAHRAGEPLEVDKNQLFRRETDRWVRDHFGRQPLDVGADRIARAAHATLELLRTLRILTGQDLPLAWDPERFGPTGCIEVYPAATLKARGLPHASYKRAKDPAHREARGAILDGLAEICEIPDPVRHRAEARDHDLDALVCLLAALDFLSGQAAPPEDRERAEKEGWIWVRQVAV